VKSQLLASAGALMVGGAVAYVSGPVLGVAMGLAVFAGALQDIKRRRRKRE